MFRRRRCHRTTVWAGLTLVLLVITSGGSCPFASLFNVDPNPNPLPPTGNRPPRVFITSITTDFGNQFAEVGDPVTIGFTGEDAEDAAVVRVFASTSGNPTPAQEIPILGGFPVGPGTGSGLAMWDTAGVATGAYNIFAEIDDRTLDPFTGVGNPPVRVVSALPVQVGPPGSQPTNSPPQLVFVQPLVNLGLSAGDVATLQYIYADVDDPVVVTLFLDADLIPSNAGDILLPSGPREATDPVEPGDDPNNPTDPDSLEVRTNPRNLNQTAPGVLPFVGAPLAGELKTYRFTIDFSLIPVSTTPYFIKATITDGLVTKTFYAVGSLTISAGASGIVDVTDIGFTLAGARFQGFSAGENLGTDYVAATDLDMDGVEDFMVASRFGSPRNRNQSGVAYLVYGRRKTPFPLDTDGDGLPDGGVTNQDGMIVNFPEPPDYLPDPYGVENVGRFGGTISVNSIASFFRGTLYAMPEAHVAGLPPGDLFDPLHPNANSSGLTSIARVDMTDDGVADLVFGVPFVAGAYDNHDDDPADGCDSPYVNAFDPLPNAGRCSTTPQSDDMWTPRVNSGFDAPLQGLVLMVDGTNDIRNQFRRFVDAGIAGQIDELGAIDDEGVLYEIEETIPRGCRFRGGWFDFDFINGMGIDTLNEYGRTVAALPSFDNDLVDELLVSSPGHFFGDGHGKITVWLSTDYLDDVFYVDDVLSLPSYDVCPGGTCTMGMPTVCLRCFEGVPNHSDIIGALEGDRLGFATSAGQFNQDGTSDILCGAPGADRDGLVDNGIVYVLFTPQGGLGDTDNVETIPRMEIRGTHSGDAFGSVQSGLQDVNGDSLDDIAFASEGFDADVDGVPGEEAGVGYVGVVFGSRPLTGEVGFTPNQVGTPLLAGVRFLGRVAGANAGRDVSTAGDFNGDGYGDLLISSPGETRVVDGELRTGVAYLVFGGPHLDPMVNGNADNVFNLSEVGQPQLPGIVFIARTLPGAGAETIAAIETVGGVGDVDGDGFDDVFIGAPKADFVNSFDPTQRRADAGEIYLIYGNNQGSNQLP